jgi:hypothetical protein
MTSIVSMSGTFRVVLADLGGYGGWNCNEPLSGTGREIQLAQKRLIARVVGNSAPQWV